MDQDVFVNGTSPVVSLGSLVVAHVLNLGQYDAENLITGPERNLLENSWLRKGFLVVNPHHQIYQILELDERNT